MGFLDSVKKGLDDVAKNINQAVSNPAVNQPVGAGAAPAPTGGSPAAPNPDAYVDDSYIDGSAPQTWLGPPVATPEDLLAPGLGMVVAFADPQVFETDEGTVARYVDQANGLTLDVISIDEDFLGRFQTHQALFEHFSAPLGSVEQLDFGDAGINGSRGQGHVEVVVSLADMVAKFDLYGPEGLDLSVVAANLRDLARAALRW